MRKSLLLIFSISLILFISACDKTPEKPTGPFIGGTSGVSVEFMTSAPPSQFNQGESVPVRVIVKNKGEEDLVEGNTKVRIYGVKNENFGLTNNYLGTPGNLRGVSGVAEGGEQRIDFGNLNYNLDIVNSEDFTLHARLCYPYKTRAKVDVCIKSIVAEESGESVCTLTGEKVTKNSVSSAPVQITSVKEDTRGSSEVRFDITIENKGLGEVFTPEMQCEDYENDEFRLSKEDIIVVKIINPIGVKCAFLDGEEDNEGEIALAAGKDVLSCWLNTEEAYEDKLDVTLSYFYFDKASKDVTIFER
ncbi:hypothetical protein HYT51_00565 [Candidatus Woesearchaeota archaeon]|nr:hypothetical protein [Candidatus Woesearchaeota archaeon]